MNWGEASQMELICISMRPHEAQAFFIVSALLGCGGVMGLLTVHMYTYIYIYIYIYIKELVHSLVTLEISCKDA